MNIKRKESGNTTWLGWLRQSPAKPNSRHMLEHIERLKVWRSLDLPIGIERLVHQNRLLKIAREGSQMATTDLAKFEAQRRYATLVALAIEGTATVTDEIINLHDRIIGKLFNVVKNRHQQGFQSSGKAINNKVRLYGRIGQVLLDAKQNGRRLRHRPVPSWALLSASKSTGAQPADFDFLPHQLCMPAPLYPSSGHSNLRAAATAPALLDALDVLRDMYVCLQSSRAMRDRVY
jgi:hypothetical protein